MTVIPVWSEPAVMAIPSSSQLVLEHLKRGDCYSPHVLLGLHHTADAAVIRVWSPEAQSIHIELEGSVREMVQVDPAGLFSLLVPASTTFSDYRIYHSNGLIAHDPYAFLPSIGDYDTYFFSSGVHYELYRIMGARSICHQGIEGVRCTVWAPNARAVSFIGDLNHWDTRTLPMRSLGSSGIWELFIPGLQIGSRYKLAVLGQDGIVRIKADPFALSSELRPSTASVVAPLDAHHWQDQAWLEKRRVEYGQNRPMNVYEMHLGSWKKPHGQFPQFREIAKPLADYCVEMGFTHIELLPIAEHPLDESWGYQVTGFFAVTSRYGSPEDFQYFIDILHQHEIGVLLDWVPAHFPSDSFSLGAFDGSSLYEHADARQGWHPHWKTHIFNYGRREVSNFLIANALFWLEMFHIDGLRVDAVASMLYLDYGREAGEWVPNIYGGKENLAAIEFLKHLNSVVHKRVPGALMIAEESTSFTGVTHSLSDGGLGFDFKWNMGWMNDTLRYINKDPLYRKYHHHDLTFGLLYAFSERFALVFSHDEVVHGKKSLLAKMPGDTWQQFANLRLLLSYQICQPGKKLLFMGGEFGQWNEWNCKQELDWMLHYFPVHQGIARLVKELNHLYKDHSAFWAREGHYSTFQWVDGENHGTSVISYLRHSDAESLLCIHHFTPHFYPHYSIPLKNAVAVEELLNTDNEKYGGSGKAGRWTYLVKNHAGKSEALELELPPLATMIFRVKWNM